MEGKKINPRLLNTAIRQRNEGFLEAEARKSEEARRFLEEQKKEIRERDAQMRLAKLESQRLDDKHKEELKEYLVRLNNYEGSELETSFYAFVSHPDFPIIYNQLGTIPTAEDKWGFILRRAYEIGNEVEVLIGYNFQNNPVNIKRKLEDYGIDLLCPYFKEDEKSLTGENCLIDGESISSSCGGQYESCVVFRDRAGKAAAGQFNLPAVNK